MMKLLRDPRCAHTRAILSLNGANVLSLNRINNGKGHTAENCEWMVAKLNTAEYGKGLRAMIAAAFSATEANRRLATRARDAAAARWVKDAKAMWREKGEPRKGETREQDLRTICCDVVSRCVDHDKKAKRARPGAVAARPYDEVKLFNKLMACKGQCAVSKVLMTHPRDTPLYWSLDRMDNGYDYEEWLDENGDWHDNCRIVCGLFNTRGAIMTPKWWQDLNVTYWKYINPAGL